MPGIFEPLVPQTAIDPMQKWLDQRRLDQSPEEAQLRGFGSGALEGLRSLTSPINLAGMLPGGAAAKLLKFAPRAARAMGPSMEVLEDLPGVAQAMPSMDEVTSLLGGMKQNLARVPQAGQRAQVLRNLPTEMQQPITSGPVQGLKRAVDPIHEERFRKYVNR